VTQSQNKEIRKRQTQQTEMKITKWKMKMAEKLIEKFWRFD
jgi:hypothetical protein